MKQFLDELKWRGLLQDATPGLAERLATGTAITAYVGFDPTAPSLQVGNLVPVMLLSHLQRAGGKAIVVMGGGTGMVGDPSGKSEERPLLSAAELDANVRRQDEQFRKLLPGVEMVDNATWLRSLGLMEFLRDIGKHFTISVMLQKDSVKSRLDQGISYTEFSYMLTQAYDFWHLFRERHCELQMGGSDQWGNITAGVELIRKREGKGAHCLTAPLITTAAGTKFGKSEGKALWLDAGMTQPQAFYNFWVSTDDRDVERYLRMFTFRPRDEIAELMRQHISDPGARVPHRALAESVSDMVHGMRVTGEVKAMNVAVRGSGIVSVDLSKLSGTYTWNPNGPNRVEDLFVAAGLASSKSDARRLLAGNGLKLNDEVPTAGQELTREDVRVEGDQRVVKVSKGKKPGHFVRIVGLE